MSPARAEAALAPVSLEVVDRVRSRLVRLGAGPDPGAVAAALRGEGVLLDDRAMPDAVEHVRRQLVGAGPLEPLLRQPAVTDVLVNGPDEVWVDRGRGLERVAVRLSGEAELRALGQRLAAAAGRRLDDASPYVDARLPGGVRLHAVLPPISPRGTLLSLRVLRRAPFTLDELVATGCMPAAMAATLVALVATRVAFLVTGGTGCGKTTLLAALLGRCDPRDRVVLVEDCGELMPDHPHLVRLEARPPNIEGHGAVTLRDLVRQALRMRPDRLVVGEVRGAEVVDLLAALNTGHEGGAATLHANEVGDVPARVEALALAAGMDRTAVHAQLAAGLQVIVHLRRRPDGSRVVDELGWLSRRPDGEVSVQTAVRLDDCPGPATAQDPDRLSLFEGPGAEALARRLGGRPWA